jgi:hypothetical protein
MFVTQTSNFEGDEKHLSDPSAPSLPAAPAFVDDKLQDFVDTK